MMRFNTLTAFMIVVSSAFVLAACNENAAPSAATVDESAVTEVTRASVTNGTEDIRLESRLQATPADPLASGTARWESRPDRLTFTCEVEDVTTSGNHEIRVNGVRIGFVNVSLGFGDLNLDSRDGDGIPTMQVGDRVQVRNPSGMVILRGRLALR